MEKTLIVTLPEHDLVTKYCSTWSSEILEVAKKTGTKIIELRRAKAEKSEVLGRIKKLKPELLILNGHGNEHCVAGHDDNLILQCGEKIDPIKVIFARACKAAQVLGQELVTNGVSAFIGYKEDFIIRIDKNSMQKILQNKVAELYMKPSNLAPITLLKGSTAGEANDKSIDEYKRTIEKLLLEGPKSEFYQEIRYLYWNMTHQVCLGNPATKL